MPSPAPSHRAIALLVCGKTTGKTLAENGDYPEIYLRFLQASLDAVHPQKPAALENPNHTPRWQFSLDPYDVVRNQEYPSAAKIELIITTLRRGGGVVTVRPDDRVGSPPTVDEVLEGRNS